MTFDEFVRQPQAINDRILHQLEKAERLQMLCNRATATYSDVKVQTSRGNQREKWLAAYIDSKNELNDLMDEYDEVADNLQAWLYDNLETTDASILTFRYIDGLQNDDIAERLHYAPQTLKNKVSKAVKTARAIYERGQSETNI